MTASQGKWWEDAERCADHEKVFCNDCRPNKGATEWVFITKGGECYHFNLDCDGLESGRQKASDAGLPRHPVRDLPLAKAVTMGRKPCLRCTG